MVRFTGPGEIDRLRENAPMASSRASGMGRTPRSGCGLAGAGRAWVSSVGSWRGATERVAPLPGTLQGKPTGINGARLKAGFDFPRLTTAPAAGAPQSSAWPGMRMPCRRTADTGSLARYPVPAPRPWVSSDAARGRRAGRRAPDRRRSRTHWPVSGLRHAALPEGRRVAGWRRRTARRRSATHAATGGHCPASDSRAGIPGCLAEFDAYAAVRGFLVEDAPDQRQPVAAFA